MSRVVLSCGSNEGDSLCHLRSVVTALGDAVTAVSPVYRTAPWGGVEQNDFKNVIVVASAPRTGDEWLEVAHRIEDAAGRDRSGERWGPRTLDVDLIQLVDEREEPVMVDQATLTLPHPRAHERAFVLIPWLVVEPAARLRIDGVMTEVSSLIERLPSDEVAGVELSGEYL